MPNPIHPLQLAKRSLQETLDQINLIYQHGDRFDEEDFGYLIIIFDDCQRKINRLKERLPLVEPRDDVNMLHEKLPKLTATNFRDPKDTPRDETPYLGAGGDGFIKVHTTGGDPEKDTKISPVKIIFFIIYTIGFIAFLSTIAVFILRGWSG